MSSDWADPGYFSGESRVRNAGRVLWQLIRPPRGHRTLPTKTGLMLILITLGIGTAAFNTAQNMLYLVLALLLSCLLMSGMLAWTNFKGCRWRVKAARHFRVGEVSSVTVEIENTKSWLPTYSLHFILESKLSGVSEMISMKRRLEPGGHMELDWYFTPERRGTETLMMRGLVSKFPFGFLRKSIQDSYAKEVMVWPSRCAYRAEFRASEHAHRQGSEKSRKGRGAELVNLREYRKGDPLHDVHWKASAHVGTLMVRETTEENREAYLIEIDPSPNLWTDTGTFEHMCSLAGTLAEDLFCRDRLSGYRIVGQESLRVMRIGQLHEFLDVLATLERVEIRGSQPTSGNTHTRIHFKPGNGGNVKIYLENHVIGETQ